MKASDVLIYVFCIAGALAGHSLLMPPLSWAAVGICAIFAAWTWFAADPESRAVLRLAGLSWSMEDFVRGWLITGRTGSGKTQCAIKLNEADANAAHRKADEQGRPALT